MKLLYGWEQDGTEIKETSDGTTVSPDPTNTDTTDFPRKGCRVCGKRDRPQYKGVCNDGHCQVP